MDDDLPIPAFLRREVTPATKAAVTRINNELRSGGRRIEKTAGRSSISAGHALNLDEAGQALLKEIKSKERKTEELRKREAFARLRALKEERSMSKKIGKKERALRDARAGDTETDGAGRIKRTGKKKAELAPPTVMVDDASMATSPVVEQAVTVAELGTTEQGQANAESWDKIPAIKKAGKKKAKAKAVPLGDIRKGSKLEMVARLLQRPEGCTSADVLKATGWPSVSMPQQAKAAGLKLRQKKEGKVTRYHAA